MQEVIGSFPTLKTDVDFLPILKASVITSSKPTNSNSRFSHLVYVEKLKLAELRIIKPSTRIVILVISIMYEWNIRLK